MNKTYDISDRQFFMKTFNYTDSADILNGYTSMISEFLACASENIHIHNTKYYIFVIQRGLETLKHCFKLIYLYTKNAELALFHCRKAFCYYIEFMGQIGEDSHTYLQLNSKDATLFVYKKTIFEIDNEYRKSYSLEKDEKVYLDLISTNIDIFGEILMNILYLTDDVIDKRAKTINYAISQAITISSKLNSKTKIKNPVRSIKDNKNILFFVTIIKEFVDSSYKYSELCDSFIKKNKKKDITRDHIYEKLYRNDCIGKLGSLTSLRFINWLYSDRN